ncbi:hypothetical protein MTO96_027593 [Rhipicephalus appendiculatus]
MIAPVQLIASNQSAGSRILYVNLSFEGIALAVTTALYAVNGIDKCGAPWYTVTYKGTTLNGIDDEDEEATAAAGGVCVGESEEEETNLSLSSSSSQDARPLLSQGWASLVPQATSGFQRESQPPLLLLPDGPAGCFSIHYSTYSFSAESAKEINKRPSGPGGSAREGGGARRPEVLFTERKQGTRKEVPENCTRSTLPACPSSAAGTWARKREDDADDTFAPWMRESVLPPACKPRAAVRSSRVFHGVPLLLAAIRNDFLRTSISSGCREPNTFDASQAR